MDFTDTAGWKQTIQDHDSYMESEDQLSPFSIIPGWRKELCYRDFAHMDLLGYGRDLGGGMIKSMHIRKELGNGPLDEQLRGLWGEINEPTLPIHLFICAV